MRPQCPWRHTPNVCRNVCNSRAYPGRPGRAGRVTRVPHWIEAWPPASTRLAASQAAIAPNTGTTEKNGKRATKLPQLMLPHHRRGVVDDQETVNGDDPKEKRDRQQSEGDRDNVPARDALHLGMRRWDDETVTRDVARSARTGWPRDAGSRVRDRSRGRVSLAVARYATLTAWNDPGPVGWGCDGPGPGIGPRQPRCRPVAVTSPGCHAEAIPIAFSRPNALASAPD